MNVLVSSHVISLLQPLCPEFRSCSNQSPIAQIQIQTQTLTKTPNHTIALTRSKTLPTPTEK